MNPFINQRDGEFKFKANILSGCDNKANQSELPKNDKKLALKGLLLTRLYFGSAVTIPG